MSLKRFLSAFPVLALAALVAAFAARPALAQEIDDDQADVSLFARVLGAAGLLAIPRPGIEYQERPGLVVPPTMTNIQPAAVPPQLQTNAEPNPWNFSPAQIQAPQQEPLPQTSSLQLPPPATPNTARLRNPDFPVDPEIRAAKKAQDAKKKKGPRLIADDPFYGGRALRPDEMRSPGPRANPTRNPGQDRDVVNSQPSRDFTDLPVITNLFGGSKKENQPQTFTGEQERQSLTQPPSGYLTPSANAPYGVVSREKQEQEAPTVHPNMPNAPTPQTR